MDLNPKFKDTITPTKWDTPEKAVAGLIAIGTILAGVIFWSTIAAWVVALLANTLMAIGLGLILTAIVVVLINPKFRTAMSYGFQMFLRGIAGIVVNTNKIEVMFIRLEKAKADLDKYDIQIGKLEGQKVDQDTKYASAMQELRSATAKAEYAKKMFNQITGQDPNSQLQKAEYKSQYDLALITITAKTDLSNTYKEGSDQLEKALTFFKNLRGAMDFAIRKSEIELTTIKAKYENIKAMHSTISTAMRIIKGNPDDNYMFELAMQKTNEEMTQKLGEIKQAADSAKDFIGNYNMEKGVLLERGQAILDQGSKLSILKDYDEHEAQTLGAGPSLNIQQNIASNAGVQSTSLLD